LGSKVGQVAGERFLLIGDAASLSNPLSGTGMGNAILSGKLAAEQVLLNFKSNDFSKTAMAGYESRLDTAIVKDLMASYKAQRLLSKMPFMLDAVFTLGKYKGIKNYLQSIV